MSISTRATTRQFDVLAIGRSSIDLYANEIGAPFTDIKNFAAYVGGCPTNISVGAQRLGLRTALVNSLGDDAVGDFVLKFLDEEGVDTRFSKRKTGRRTSAFLLAIEPPENFTIVPYRDNCADLELSVDDIRDAPIADARALLITGTGFSRQPSQAATLHAAEQAQTHETKVILDLDFRPELWSNTLAYGIAMRAAMKSVDIVIGTLDEITYAFTQEYDSESDAREHASAANAAHSDPTDGIKAVLADEVEAVVVKRGAASTIIHLPENETLEAATFPVEVLNVLGAGDAFASGFLYGYLRNWDWQRCARMGNACGALLVTRHGCANFMPYEHEVLSFINERGGF